MNKRANILVVDDSELIRKMITNMLNLPDYSVEEAENGIQALKKIQNREIDLLILDVIMPEMDGLEVLKVVKSDTTLRNIPVIIITGVDDMKNAAKCIKMGAEDYLHKPFDKTLLLARVFSSLERKRLLDQEQEFIRQVEHELKLAGKIQRNLIPKEFPEVDNIEFHAIYNPMYEIGGDFYDFIQLREREKIGIFISDVSGHGVPAALITSMIKIFIETAGKFKKTPRHLLLYLNEKLKLHSHDSFISAFYGLIDVKKRRFTYSRGGHPYPLLIRDGKIIPLDSQGPLLAIFNEIEIEERDLKLLPNDKIIFYTDGLTEAQNDKQESFEHKFLDIVQKDHSGSIKSLLEKLNSEFFSHLNKAPLLDDVSIIGVEIK